MDAPLAQVQLAAHIVTINSESLRELGVRWGLAPDDRPAQPLRPGNLGVNLPLERSAVNVGFHLARISGRLLSLELTALEQENQVEIIASPRLLTAHLQTASIKQGTEIPLRSVKRRQWCDRHRVQRGGAGHGGDAESVAGRAHHADLAHQPKYAGARHQPRRGEALTIDKQEIKTQITVKNGETLVLGGIFQRHSGKTADKVPGLADAPLLGGLFRQSGAQQKNASW